MVRGAWCFPMDGSNKRVLVFAKGDKSRRAEGRAADVCRVVTPRREDHGWLLEFDTFIANPGHDGDQLDALGPWLGPRGLDANPEADPVTFDVAKA
ncbi:UNVERIFIED_CONTAM: hypothetical protein GTU68_016546 [Idotea baltica]|nr:hypothetical protein [Idotea baltica]